MYCASIDMVLFMLIGDCNKCIHLWEPTGDSWKVDSTPFMGHAASVEDLQVTFSDNLLHSFSCFLCLFTFLIPTLLFGLLRVLGVG